MKKIIIHIQAILLPQISGYLKIFQKINVLIFFAAIETTLIIIRNTDQQGKKTSRITL